MENTISRFETDANMVNQNLHGSSNSLYIIVKFKIYIQDELARYAGISQEGGSIKVAIVIAGIHMATIFPVFTNSVTILTTHEILIMFFLVI